MFEVRTLNPARDALKLVRRMWPHRFARGLCARPEWALLGYHGRVLVSARVQELKSLPVRARRS